MRNIFRIGVLVFAAALLGACANRPVSVDYAAFKQSKPRSILIMPPLNQSPDVDASYSVLSVATLPLAESGYYVMPVALVSETFKQNGVTVANDAQEIPLAKLREIFGADAALYISVNKYGTSYRVLNSVAEVSVSAKLVDLRSGAKLWSGSAYASTGEGDNGGGGGLVGLLVGAVVKQVMNNITDRSHDMAVRANVRLLAAGRPGSVLYGPYSPRYGTD